MTLHILKKDVRRLWPAVLVSLVVLGGVAWHDRWRTDASAGDREVMLNLLTGIVWMLLLGLAVGQEPIAGDRQFWLTRPYSRRALLGAKLLFAALFVHAPSLLAECVILGGRGFPPFEYVGQLLWRQAMLACALTLPAIALATLVRTFTHFVLVLVVVGFLVNGGLDTRVSYGELMGWLRWKVGVLVAAGASVVVLGLQYYGRRVAWSRASGAAGFIAAVLFSGLSPHAALGIRTGTDPAPSVPSLRLDTGGRKYARYHAQRDVAVVLPVVVEGLAGDQTVRLNSVRSELVSGGGRRYLEDAFSTRTDSQNGPYGLSVGKDETVWWMFIRFAPDTYAALQDAPVTLSGEIAATMIRNGEPAWLSVGEARAVEGIGRCAASLTSDRVAERIKVICEAQRIEAPLIPARLWSPELRREWKLPLGFRYTTPLSPLDRVQSSAEIVPEPMLPMDRRVPASAAASARIEVIPQDVLGYAAVRYEFRNLDLREYRLPNLPAGR